MENQSIVQQPKRDPRGKAITSLVFGAFGLIVSIIFTYFIPSVISMIILYVAFIMALIGLVLGISGLRSTKKKLAILGIILCISTLILVLKIFLYGPF